MRFQIGLAPLLSLLVGACTVTALWVQRPELRAVTVVLLVFVLVVHALLAWLWNWSPPAVDDDGRAEMRLARIRGVRRAGEALAILAALALLSALALPPPSALVVAWTSPSLIAMGACTAAATYRWKSRVPSPQSQVEPSDLPH